MHEGFKTGRYHTLVKQGDYLPLDRHERILRYDYTKSLYLIKNMVSQRGWRNPFTLPNPRFAQIGSAMAETARTFINFVHQINPQASIFITDISSTPLQDSINSGIRNGVNKVHFLQADTFSLPIKPNSLDLIETDGLLQFFDDPIKADIIDEWFRTLKPGAIVTTRDWMLPPDAPESLVDEAVQRQREMQQFFGVSPVLTTRRNVEQLFRNAGFEIYVEQSITEKNLHYIIARKPE